MPGSWSGHILAIITINGHNYHIWTYVIDSPRFRARFVERAEALLAEKGLPSGGGGGTSLVHSMGDLVEIREWAQQGMTWHDALDMSVYSNNRRI